MSQKRGFQMVLCTQKVTQPSLKIPKASEVRTKPIDGSWDKLPQVLLDQIQNPSIAIGIDVETHGWLEDSSRKGHIGQFGFYTMSDDASLKFARIVQIAWVTGKCKNDSQTASKCYLVKPSNFQIESKATKFHGISHEIASDQGRDLKDVLREFMKDVSDAVDGDGIVVAHQIEFDAGVIYHELGRCGYTDLQSKWADIARRGFCTMSPSIGRWLLKSSGEDVGPITAQHTLGLSKVARMIIPKRQHTKPHDAECDANMSRWIFLAILEQARLQRVSGQ